MKNQLVEQIEAQLNWGDSTTWTNKDFQELSERIFSRTRKQLSVTTLKRVWGRAESIANPSAATLDILSEFAGYSSWRQFCQSKEANLSGNARQQNPVKPARRYKVIGWLVGLAVLGVILYAFVEDAREESPKLSSASLDHVEFSFQKVTAGYPNTVIFRYDIGDIPYDSLAIQQSWDTRKRIPLTQPQGLVTTTYYYPGYFLTKLLVNDQVVREEDLYIPTRGWQGLVLENEDEFVYLKPEQLFCDSTLRVAQDVLFHLNEHPSSLLYLANLTDKPLINSAHFSLETEFRLQQPAGRSICQNVRLTLTGTKDVFGFQFSIPGCVGDLMFVLNKEMVSGKDHDLSGFGVDLSRWTTCKIEMKDEQLSVLLNGKPVFQHLLAADIGKIGGVQWTFEGLGEVRQLILQDEEITMNLIK